jgi:hypothetical protein
VAGELPKLLDDILKIEMGIWDDCLPASGGCENNCIYEGSILVHGGNIAHPVSDAMERIANYDQTAGKFKSALQRYKTYLEQCTDVWDGWKSYNENEKYNSNPTSSIIAGSPTTSSSPSFQQGIPQKALSVIWLFVGVLVGIRLMVAWERRGDRKWAPAVAVHQLELFKSAAAAAAAAPSPSPNRLLYHDFTESSNSDEMVDEII